jgi:predicted TIM-barrel fold metal-dependent hydrolase
VSDTPAPPRNEAFEEARAGGVVDTFLSMPAPRAEKKKVYDTIRRQTMDDESKSMEMPAEYMFKDVPDDIPEGDDPVRAVINEMDHWGIAKAMVGIAFDRSISNRAIEEHPDRFFASYEVNPNLGMKGVRDLVRAHEEYGVKAASAFPAGMNPQVPINDKRFYPVYAKCVELDIPICVCAGVPGPRVPFAPQEVGLIDEVCWFFPELKFVTRHGCEPWADLAVKLMLKWPNLHYSTSAFAPKFYPKDVVHYANTRGADKVMYAGYFPMGLTLERIFTDMPDVPFRDHVWPKFLRENAVRVFKLDE